MQFKNEQERCYKAIIHFQHTFFNTSETFIRRQMEFHRYFKPVAVCFKAINLELKPSNTLLFKVPRSPLDMTRSVVPLFLPYYNTIFSNMPSLYEFYIKKLSKEELWNNIGLILTHFGNNVPYSNRLAKSLKKPLLVFFYGTDVTVLLKKSPNYYKYFEEEIEAGFALSNYLRNILLENEFSRTIYLNRLGINLKQYSFNPHGTFIENERSKKVIKIVSIGRLVEFKGHEYLIGAHNLLIKKGYNVRTTIIGTGPRYNLLYNLIRRLNLLETVRLVGALPSEKIIEYLNDSDFFVFPSVLCEDGSTETLGYACVEAMAVGLPVIASNVGGIPEYVIDGQTGLLVEQRSPRQIAEAVEELINNPRKARKLVENARKLVENMFDISKNMDKMESILMKYIT